MNNLAIINQQKQFSLIPETFEQAMQYAKLIADSDFVSRDYKGKPGNVLIAVQHGAEIGLSPMQAIQNISIINGKPSVWGDALLALVRAHHSFVDIHEEIKNGVAICRVERKNQDPIISTFSIEDAKKANLWGKQGPWTQYPNRMLQMRARSFALRDGFADVLKGLSVREEVMDYDVKPQKNIRTVNQCIDEIEVTVKDNDSLLTEINEINNCQSIKQLQEVYLDIVKNRKKQNDKEAIRQIIEAKDKRKEELNVAEFKQELQEAELVDVKTGEVINE